MSGVYMSYEDNGCKSYFDELRVDNGFLFVGRKEGVLVGIEWNYG